MTNNKDIVLNFLELEQSVGVFYSCVIKAQTLLELCTFDFRQIRENNGVKEFLGIQRPLKASRVQEISQYIRTEDGSFPTSIVISVDERCASFIVDDSGQRKLQLSEYYNKETQSVDIPFDSIATIIDGQHRLKAFEGTGINWDLSVNIFVGIDEGTQAMIFSKVNLAQTKVNKSLVYDLFSLDRGRSPEKTCHEIVVNLNDIPDSPFYKSIKRLGSATDGVFGETLSQATIVKGILPLITKDPIGDRDIGRRSGAWPDRGPKDFNSRIFYPFFQKNEDYKVLAILINYFNAVKERWPNAWESRGRGAILARTNGFNALIRFLKDAYLEITGSPEVVSKQKFLKIFEASDLEDKDFTTERFPPGTSGSAALYNELIKLVSRQDGFF
ncbi:DGQHR domain-containing protein [Ochrobactrum sp. Q0168]|uniref:DGQHR domain-containing protein n=1 Tax=Ochrobactrum sp. Q0168 TaxID=2793241 RepID=UPI0018EB3202|nr:DGQHR domain-containing protein [Ochrobactrum sp. Q0168]